MAFLEKDVKNFTAGRAPAGWTARLRVLLYDICGRLSSKSTGFRKILKFYTQPP